jgi:hypothetical protein
MRIVLAAVTAPDLDKVTTAQSNAAADFFKGTVLVRLRIDLEATGAGVVRHHGAYFSLQSRQLLRQLELKKRID